MPFLDNNIDLSQTAFTNVPFSNEDLAFARRFLEAAIRKHDPAWLKKPVGPLSVYWNDNAVPAACYLIELTRVLSRLEKNVTKKSLPILARKFGQLLRTRDQRQSDELMAEFQVACQLSERASPISFEPLVPEELQDTANKPPSPDFAIRLPEADVFVEVAVLHLGALISWDENVKRLTSELTRLLSRRRKRRVIYLYVPFSLCNSDLEDIALRDLVNEISARDHGDRRCQLPGGVVESRWEPLLHIRTKGEFPRSLPDGVRYATFDPVGSSPSCGVLWASSIMADVEADFTICPSSAAPEDGAVACEVRPYPEDLTDGILRSLRGILKRKRSQFPHEAPYLLIVQLGHHRMSGDRVEVLIAERIWPNSDYAWMTGLCLFRPRVLSSILGRPGSVIHDESSHLRLILNPGTRNPPPESLVALFEGKATCHLP